MQPPALFFRHSLALKRNIQFYRYGCFPLRKYVREIAVQDTAFNLFFAKPLLIAEHHDIFNDPEPGCLTQMVSPIHTLAPEIRWSLLSVGAPHTLFFLDDAAQTDSESPRSQI